MPGDGVVDIGGVLVNFYSEEELDQKYSLFGGEAKKYCLASQILDQNFFAKNNDKLIAESIDSEKFEETCMISREQLRQFVTVGLTNENPVFIDLNDNYSMWVLIGSNNSVFKLKKRFIINGVRLD